MTGIPITKYQCLVLCLKHMEIKKKLFFCKKDNFFVFFEKGTQSVGDRIGNEKISLRTIAKRRWENELCQLWNGYWRERYCM